MKTLALLALLALAFGAAASAEPRVAEDRIVLRTGAGDLVLALYSDVAPCHVEQLLKLTRMGVFDSTHFYRVDPSFLVQLSDAANRTVPLSPEQRAALTPLPLELSALKHVRGALTMAHRDGEPDSAETSFSILLVDAPHLDGSYTVFGRLESGWEVLDEILRVPRSQRHRPVVKIEVKRAEVVNGAKLAEASLSPATVVPIPEAFLRAAMAAEAAEAARRYVPPAIAGGILLMIALDLFCWFYLEKLSQRVVAACLLLSVLTGAFLCVVILTPSAHESQWLAIFLFAGLLGTIRLMGRLE